jgi:plastocyanin
MDEIGYLTIGDRTGSESLGTGWSRRLMRFALLGAAAFTLSLGLLSACSSPASTAGSVGAAPPSHSTMTMPGPSALSASAASRSESGSAGPAAMAIPQSAQVLHISGFTFLPPKAVAPGAHLGVMNMDGEAHTVTADTGHAFDVTVPAGRTVTLIAPIKPGRYAFHCQYHSNMSGVLVVS